MICPYCKEVISDMQAKVLIESYDDEYWHYDCWEEYLSYQPPCEVADKRKRELGG